MIKPVKIVEVAPYYIVCLFNNGEVRKLTVEPDFFSKVSKSINDSIFNTNIFNTVKIGELGQLYWENLATMKDEKGDPIPCEYDISPEFVYHYSKTFELK
jgi:hypothetical protein